MTTYKNYLELMNATRELKKPVMSFEEHAKICENFRKEYTTATTDTEREKIRANKRRLDEIDKENIIFNESLKIKLEIMQNNKRVLFNQEITPTILEILSKYNGKKYGEKTAEKIRNEIKERVNCSVYFGGYSHKTDLHITELIDGYTSPASAEIILNSNYETPFIDENNVVNGTLSLNDLRIANTTEFITDIDNYAEKLTTAKKEIIEMHDKLNALISDYNSLLFGNFEHVKTLNNIYADLFR